MLQFSWGRLEMMASSDDLVLKYTGWKYFQFEILLYKGCVESSSACLFFWCVGILISIFFSAFQAQMRRPLLVLWATGQLLKELK